MELKKIEIRNFRSIKSADIEFDHNCMILVGKNEAGKSNVLKAIAAVFGQYQITDRDKRKKIDNEKIADTDRFIRASIHLDDKDRLEVDKRYRLLLSSDPTKKMATNYSVDMFLKKYLTSFYIHLQVGSGQNVVVDFIRVKHGVQGVAQAIVNKSKILPPTDAEIERIGMMMMDIVFQIYSEKPITCHFWKYQNEYLLPNTIDIGSFISSPSICMPLQRIFQLCGRDQIAEEFQSARTEDGDYLNLLEQVSKKATATFHSIWPDFKDTEIRIIPDGGQMQIKLSSRANYNFEDRSEGFKKFVSILLMLSTQARAKKISSKDLILIDEPDQSLYPSSARFLRDELLEISKRAKVCYTTHSEYMIDADNLQRHLVVEKKDDITITNKVDNNSPFANDELLRRAIGTSIFAVIKNKNIVFEGYLDKKLFDRYLAFTNRSAEFEHFGKMFLSGISGVEAVTSILQSANKKFIVVADSDGASKDKRGVFAQGNPECKDQWLAYGDVNSEIVTMEDYFKPEFLQAEIVKLAPSYQYDANKPALVNIDKAVPNDKEKKQAIKSALALNFKLEHVKEQYQSYLDKLKEEVSK